MAAGRAHGGDGGEKMTGESQEEGVPGRSTARAPGDELGAGSSLTEVPLPESLPQIRRQLKFNLRGYPTDFKSCAYARFQDFRNVVIQTHSNTSMGINDVNKRQQTKDYP